MNPNLLIISNYSDPIAPIRPEAEIILRLKEEGFNVTVLTPAQGHYPKKMKEAGCHVVDHLPRSKFDRTTIKLIKQLVWKEGIQIIHAFNSKAIANAAWAVWNDKQVKLVSYRGYTGNIRWYDPTNYISFLNPRIDKMVCLAESVREMYMNNGVSPERAITIHKGHDHDWYTGVQAADLSEFEIAAGDMVVTLVANFRTKMKGLKHVIEAAAALPSDVRITFLMIGEGLATHQVQQWLRAYNVEGKFRFTGFRKDAASLVKAGDVALSASLFGEATQKAVIEAMNLGKPMVITDISGNRGMVEDGVSGFVVPPADGRAIASALTSMYHDEERRAQMGQAAQQHIRSFLSIDRSVKEYAALYRELASE